MTKREAEMLANLRKSSSIRKAYTSYYKLPKGADATVVQALQALAARLLQLGEQMVEHEKKYTAETVAAGNAGGAKFEELNRLMQTLQQNPTSIDAIAALMKWEHYNGTLLSGPEGGGFYSEG